MNTTKILQNLNIEALNPMQEKVLEASSIKENLILLSPTGSGKTLAFLLPVLKKLNPDVKDLQAIIIVPSRELALQIETVFKKMTVAFKINCCYGGHSTKIEVNNFSTPPAVLVGTPGRIAFHIRENNIHVKKVNALVLDEFDKALEMGFQSDMEFIIDALKGLNFRMLTSATNLKKIPDFTGIVNPERLQFLKDNDSKPDLTYKKVTSKSEDKLETVVKLISKIGKETVIIFCNHRDAVDRISEALTKKNVANGCFHGGLEQADRERALMKFRNKSSRVLITTDLAARGIDIPEIDHVIHYQVPDKEDAFIHRNGRTARMKAKGIVYVMTTNEEYFDFIPEDLEEEDLSGSYKIENNTAFKTIYISAGKKEKISKVDVVGYLIKIGGLNKEDIGLIEVKDNQTFVAVSSYKIKSLLASLENTKLKNKKVKIELAKD